MNEHLRRFDNTKWQSNPLLKTTVVRHTLPKKQGVPAIKQYGDKGYVPSNGKGVDM